MSNQRRQCSLGKKGQTGMGCLVTNQFKMEPYCSYISVAISTYSFKQISTYMISIHSFTGLGISSKPIDSLSRSNVSEKRVYVPQGHQNPIFLLDAILLPWVTQLRTCWFLSSIRVSGMRQTDAVLRPG